MPRGQVVDSELRDQVRDRYASAALQVIAGGQGSCCGDGCGCRPADASEPGFGAEIYSADERDQLLAEPGGRIGVTDVVADDGLSPADRAERGNYVGCIAGALSFAEYRSGLAEAGFTEVEITPTHPVADGMHSAIIRGLKPVGISAR